MEIITKNEIRILDFFRKNLFLKTSIRETMKKIKSKSYQRVYEAVGSLTKKNVLSSEKTGNTNLISLKFSREAILNLSFLDEQDGQKVPNYSKIMEIKEISDYLILVTGSHAKAKADKKSDLDLVIIVPDRENVVSVQKLVENLTLLIVPEIHLHVFRKKDFVDMLREKNENYGKEIVKNKIILKNAQMFYELVKEAVENGYKG
ncbi:MAG: nucleotidyltransferase domain-containing protein [Nanoarchaeota archaeon]|nr:nucleotidyltransferase domain-containing protein [Nanoarchaeota archaeon]MBU1103292.1 nucleotidyltransferase domain-containing protein [Nanoarchaeota archaeon]MBU1988974.1 nucleotidyltransferase domain-containing protein [Nanoarchaeota archaeon]